MSDNEHITRHDGAWTACFKTRLMVEEEHKSLS